MLLKGFRERFRGGQGDDDDNVIHAEDRFRLGQLEALDADSSARPYDWAAPPEDEPGDYFLGQAVMRASRIRLVEPPLDHEPQ